MTFPTKSDTGAAPRILIVEDDREMSRYLKELLAEEGYQTEVADDGLGALECYKQNSIDLVVTDLMMPRMKGIELIRHLMEVDSHALVLLITAFGTIESAVEAMNAGAFNYITKPFRADELRIQVQRALEQRQMRQEIDRLRSAARQQDSFKNIIGRSEAMKSLFATIARLTELPSNVLILGESGTGKEMVAHALHASSSRATGPFVAVNCAAIPETLLESEMFGYVRGAFTDARKDRPGLFQEANGGVLFLDEIAELPLALQAKLLRVIEDRQVKPLGSNQSVQVDVRLVSASNLDLEEMVEAGRFRRDLYYRLNVIRLDLPPLRERREDIPPLIDHFIEKFADPKRHPVTGIDKEALALLLNYRWPGNVRELEHTIERAVLLGLNSIISPQDLPPNIATGEQRKLPLAEAAARRYTLRDLEREYIDCVLKSVGGNKSEAAKTLGVDRTTLYRKLEEFKIKP